MKQILIIFFGLSANFAFAMDEEARLYESKKEFLEGYPAQKANTLNSYAAAINRASNTGESTLAGLLTQSFGITLHNLSQFENSLEKCDESLWLSKDGKKYDCNELIEMYRGTYNFNANSH